MKKQHLLFATFILAGSLTVSGQTSDTADSLSAQRTLTIDEVVVTGTRHQTDIRHLSQTVSVVNRKRIEQSMQPSLLPVCNLQIFLCLFLEKLNMPLNTPVTKAS